MKELDSNRVMNGSFGEAWVDDDYLGEVCKYDDPGGK